MYDKIVLRNEEEIMSYEKVKLISRKEKENKIFITSACSNVTPKTYSKWEYIKDDNMSFEDKEIELVDDILSGNLHTTSLYNYEYASIMTHKELSDTRYNVLYAGNQAYHLEGKKGYSNSTEISQQEFDSGKYVVISEHNDYILIENKEEQLKRQEERRAMKLKAHSIFMKHFNEKIEGEYHIYSQDYGYCKPKGSVGRFYYHSRPLECYDYKTAYVKANNILRDFELQKVIKSDYEATPLQLKEVEFRKNFLGIIDNTNDFINSFEVMQEVCNFEKEFKAKVYHISKSNTNFGLLYNFCYVSDYQDEYENDRELLKDNVMYSYVYNATYNENSEIGLIKFRVNYLNRIERVM